MTANTLSNEERARVASAVMHSPSGFVWHMNEEFEEMEIAIQKEIRESQNAGVWWPERNAFQRMALIEWITRRLGAIPTGKGWRPGRMSAGSWRAACFDIVEAIRDTDTIFLESFAHQMITKGKQDE